MEFTDEQQEMYEEQLEELSEKSILLEIMVELKAIRTLLEGEGMQGESESNYQCDMCGAIVEESQMEKHLRDNHNFPGGLDASEEFSEV